MNILRKIDLATCLLHASSHSISLIVYINSDGSVDAKKSEPIDKKNAILMMAHGNVVLSYL